ncbi:MAG TPA: hypothetical protein V6D03_16520 [Candidatus Caenarcaniphilales bacterium]
MEESKGAGVLNLLLDPPNLQLLGLYNNIRQDKGRKAAYHFTARWQQTPP